ncbi:hypothetical protein NE237_014754 [Protea cynaroides]|uniref:Myb/SANT-like domain-containing protein n=1 Tax=Protea cynaroides TaxID=273540 RepID=A0A9Q0QQF5_9MAGN|nr:hypothetical protein NE237_014754 [Protea cynaroides]
MLLSSPRSKVGGVQIWDTDPKELSPYSFCSRLFLKKERNEVKIAKNERTDSHFLCNSQCCFGFNFKTSPSSFVITRSKFSTSDLCCVFNKLLVYKMASSSRTSIETVKWNKLEVDTYVDILVEEVIKGNKTTCTFNKDGWSNIKNKMEEALGRPFSLKQLKNKLNKLRSEYGSFRRLVNTIGFGWNDKTKRVETHDPAIWDRHIQENPGWAKFRKNGLSQYQELQVIFGDLYATDEFACNNHDENIIFEEGDADNLDIKDGSEVLPVEPSIDLTEEGDVHHTPQAVAGHRLDRAPSAFRKRSRSSDIVGAINAMVEHSKARLDLFTTSHTSSASPSPSSVNTRSYSITQCLAVLNTIPGLDKATYIKTMNHLTYNAEWRELFMGLDEEKKLWAIESIP